MKMTITSTIDIEQQGTITVTSTGQPFSDDWEDVRDQWLERHAEAIAGLTRMDWKKGGPTDGFHD